MEQLDKETKARQQRFSEVMIALQVAEHLQNVLKGFSYTTPNSEAALIKVREAFGYIDNLRERHEKEEEDRIKAVEIEQRKDWEKRIAESQKEVEKFQKEQEERIAKRAAEIVASSAQVEGAERKAPDHPEPN